jgi:hypothetical protein
MLSIKDLLKLFPELSTDTASTLHLRIKQCRAPKYIEELVPFKIKYIPAWGDTIEIKGLGCADLPRGLMYVDIADMGAPTLIYDLKWKSYQIDYVVDVMRRPQNHSRWPDITE